MKSSDVRAIGGLGSNRRELLIPLLVLVVAVSLVTMVIIVPALAEYTYTAWGNSTNNPNVFTVRNDTTGETFGAFCANINVPYDGRTGAYTMGAHDNPAVAAELAKVSESGLAKMRYAVAEMRSNYIGNVLSVANVQMSFPNDTLTLPGRPLNNDLTQRLIWAQQSLDRGGTGALGSVGGNFQPTASEQAYFYRDTLLLTDTCGVDLIAPSGTNVNEHGFMGPFTLQYSAGSAASLIEINNLGKNKEILPFFKPQDPALAVFSNAGDGTGSVLETVQLGDTFYIKPIVTGSHVVNLVPQSTIITGIRSEKMFYAGESYQPLYSVEFDVIGPIPFPFNRDVYVDVVKYDNKEQKITGSEFTLWRYSDSDWSGSLTAVGTITPDSNGRIRMTDPGWYALQETTTPNGFIEDDTLYKFYFSGGEFTFDTPQGNGRFSRSVTVVDGVTIETLILSCINIPYDPGTGCLPLVGKKTVEGAALEAGLFNFTVREGSTVVSTGTNDSSGMITFTPIEFTRAGDHVFVISEDTPPGGWTANTPPITIYVRVTDPGRGEPLIVNVFRDSGYSISITNLDAMLAHLTFRNTYKPLAGELVLTGTKTVSGGTLSPGLFNFTVKEGSTTVATGTNNGSGVITFTPITFTRAGDHVFVISEDTPPGGWTANTPPITIYVRVTDPGGGLPLVATAYSDAGYSTRITNVLSHLTFRNTYQAVAADLILTGTKVANGGTMTAGLFNFTVKEGGVTVATGTNDVNGNITFTPITYTAAGDHVYVISEDTPPQGWRPDTPPFTIYVRVTDPGGGLPLVITIYRDAAYTTPITNVVAHLTFANTYRYGGRLPETGGMGTDIFTAAAFISVSVLAALYVPLYVYGPSKQRRYG